MLISLSLCSYLYESTRYAKLYFFQSFLFIFERISTLMALLINSFKGAVCITLISINIPLSPCKKALLVLVQEGSQDRDPTETTTEIPAVKVGSTETSEISVLRSLTEHRGGRN